MDNAKSKTVRIFDKQAVELVNQRAAREHRSAANAASITIIESLGKKPQRDNPPGPAFLDNVIVKGQENLSSGKLNKA